jgi:4-amino-4-deoxy-L-arabinose transferase-like glycosyltransferase
VSPAFRHRTALVFLAGLALRLAFVAFEPATRPLGDERTWLVLGLEWVAAPPASFDPFVSPLLFYPPLHPYLIAAAATLGGGLGAVKIVQALLSALLIPAVASIGRRAFGPGVGLAAAAATAVYPTLIWYSAHFWSEPLFLVLLWWGLERALAADEGRGGAAAASGVLLGLAALTREVPLYFVPALALWMVGRRGRASLVRALVLLAATTAVVAPWTLRNWVRFGAFVPVSTMGGRALWEGNTLGDRGELYAEHDRIAREEGQVAAYRHAVREGLRSIRERQPRWILDKTVHELDGLFTPIDMALVHLQKGGYGPPSLGAAWVVAAVTVPPYLAAMTLFIVGLARIRWTRARGLLVLFFAFYVLLHVVVHGHHRFRLALLPVAFTVGASVISGLSGAAAPWTRARRLLAATLLLAFAVSAFRAVRGLPEDPAFRDASVGPTARVPAWGAARE